MNIYCIHQRGTNIGNEVIYLGVKHFLGNSNVIRIANLTADSVYEINQYGDGVIVGGGNFYENNAIEIDLNALKALEPPLFLFSLSHGRIFNRKDELVRRTDCMPDEKVIALNEKAYISSVRDSATQEYLKGLGCQSTICGCPSQFVARFNLTLPEVESGQWVFARNPELMSVMPAKRRQVFGEVESFVKAGYTMGCNDKRDIPFAAAFHSRYVYFDDVYYYLATIKAAKRIVSYRLHATFPALSFGIPVTNITYDERGLSAMESLSDSNYGIIQGLFTQFLTRVRG